MEAPTFLARPLSSSLADDSSLGFAALEPSFADVRAWARPTAAWAYRWKACSSVCQGVAASARTCITQQISCCSCSEDLLQWEAVAVSAAAMLCNFCIGLWHRGADWHGGGKRSGGCVIILAQIPILRPFPSAAGLAWPMDFFHRPALS